MLAKAEKISPSENKYNSTKLSIALEGSRAFA